MIMPLGTARMVTPSGLKRDQHQEWAIRQDGYAFGLEMEWIAVMGWCLCLRARWVCLLARRACLWVLWNGHRSGWHNGYACGPLNGTNISNWIWVQWVCLLVKWLCVGLFNVMECDSGRFGTMVMHSDLKKNKQQYNGSMVR